MAVTAYRQGEIVRPSCVLSPSNSAADSRSLQSLRVSLQPASSCDWRDHSRAGRNVLLPQRRVLSQRAQPDGSPIQVLVLHF